MKVPSIAISRLSVYARSLAVLDENGVEVVSSGGLADICGVNPAQIRKDLAYFGEFGVRGVGYYVKELLFETRRILGADRQWRLALVGVGNLGWALLRHVRMADHGYTFVAAFDKRPKRIGIKIGDVRIAPLEAMSSAIKDKRIDIGVIAVKPEEAQEAVDILVRAGVCGILNFAPRQLQCPAHVHVENADFSLKLDMLFYRLTLGTSR